MNFVYTARSRVPLAVTNGESIGRGAAPPASRQPFDRRFGSAAFRLRGTQERTVAARLPDARTAGRNNLDVSAIRDTALFESLRLRFRAEFGGPDANFNNAEFGRVASQIDFARQIQFGLRLLW